MPSSQGTTRSTNTVSTNMGPWSEQGPYLQQGFAQAGNLLMNTDPKYYPGKTVAGFDPAQTQGYQSIIDRATAGSPLTPAMNRTTLDTIEGKYLDPATNPWLSKTFAAGADDVTRAYQTATAPQTAGGFAAAGRYGSGSYQTAQANNQRNLGTTLDRLATDIYGGNYQAERSRQMNAIGMAPGVLQANYLEPTAMVNAGAARQEQAQRELSDEVARWNTESNPASQWDELAKYMGIVGANNWGQSGTQQSFGQQPNYSNPLGSILGGGLAGLGTIGSLLTPGASGVSALGNLGLGSLFSGGAGIAPSMLSPSILAALPFAVSDVRAKEDIRPVGQTYDGQNLYQFRYKGDPTPHVGLMAQEVEQRDPDAVITRPDGLKMVNYDRALEGATR